MFQSLLKGRIVVRTPGGKLYLDPEAEARANQVQLKIVGALLVAGLIALAWALALRRPAP